MPNKGTWKIDIGGQPFADYGDVVELEGVAGGHKILEVHGYGAPAPTYINLGNLTLPRKFTITEQHDTDTDAHDFYQTGNATWGGVQTVVLTHVDYSGVETKWQIAGAKVELDIPSPIGPTTITKLTITGGAAAIL